MALFVLALFAASWTFGLLLPPQSQDLSSFLMRLVPVVWMPTILALVFVVVTNGMSGVRQELEARLSYRQGSTRWLILAAAVPIFAVALAVFSARAVGDGAPFTPSGGIFPMIGIQIVTGAVGEGLGWRGFLLPRLGRMIDVTASFWVMGTLWSLWHLPAFLTPGMPHQFMPVMLVLPFIAFFGVFMGFAFDRAGESVLATIAAHLSLNIMTGLGGAMLSSSTFWGTLAATFGVLAVLVTISSRRRPKAAVGRADDALAQPTDLRSAR